MSDSQSFNRGRWQKGQSGNPKGRALERTIAERLRQTSEFPGYADVPFKNIMARFLWDAAISGTVELISGQVMQLTPGEWLDLCKWLGTHVDGGLHIQRYITSATSNPDMPLGLLNEPAETLELPSESQPDPETDSDENPPLTSGFIDPHRIA